MNRRDERASNLGILRLLILMVGFIGSVAAICVAASTSPATAPITLLANQASHTTWLVHKLPDTSAANWVVLRRQSIEDANAGWLPIANIPGTPTHLATLGERLAILLDNGTWLLVGKGTTTIGPSLPDGYDILAICTGIDDRLAFIGRNEHEIAQFAFNGSQFERIAPMAMPDGELLDVVDSPMGLLIATRIGDDIEVRNPLSADALMAQVKNAKHVQLLQDRSATRLIIQRDDGIHTATLAGVTVLNTAELSLDATLSDRPAVVLRDEELVAWWVGDDDAIYEQRFDRDGTLLSQAAPIEMGRGMSPPLFERVLYIVGAIALIVLLVVGGRQSAGTHRTPAATLRPAPLARRLAAGLIDTIPLVAACVYLSWRGGLTTQNGMLQFDSYTSEAILAAAVLVYLMLIAACELRWRQSLGKKIFALRVVALDGTEPTIRATLIRNLLRLVDLNLITLLIVPLTPLRQRLGDYVAGTTVVDAADTFPPAVQDKGSSGR